MFMQAKGYYPFLPAFAGECPQELLKKDFLIPEKNKRLMQTAISKNLLQ